jgi:hypothetical protein
MQLEGERPYDASRGNIIRGRRWKEIRGGNGPNFNQANIPLPRIVQRMINPQGQNLAPGPNRGQVYNQGRPQMRILGHFEILRRAKVIGKEIVDEYRDYRRQRQNRR